MSLSKTFGVVMLASTLASVGCQESPEDAAYAKVSLIDRNTSAISSSYDIESLNGTYTGCTNRTGNWSIAVSGSPTLDHDQLSVIRGDISCSLAITEIVSTSLGTLSASAAMPLGTSWGTARSFGSPIKFYANAMVGSVDFSSNFALTVLYSDDPSAASGSNTANFATVSTSSASAQGVTAPNYTMDLSGVTVLTDVSGVTTSVSGNVALTAGSATGDFYVIVSGSVGSTYAAINTAYGNGTPVAMSTSIAGSAILGNGVNLTGSVVRTLIIAKVSNGVNAYQRLTITFNPPT